MYIRGLILQNFAELAEKVPIAVNWCVYQSRRKKNHTVDRSMALQCGYFSPTSVAESSFSYMSTILQYNYSEVRYISGIYYNKRWSIVYIEGQQVIFLEKIYFPLLMIVSALANSLDPNATSGSALFDKITI